MYPDKRRTSRYFPLRAEQVRTTPWGRPSARLPVISSVGGGGGWEE